MNNTYQLRIDPSTLPPSLFDKFIGDDNIQFTPDGLDWSKLRPMRCAIDIPSTHHIPLELRGINSAPIPYDCAEDLCSQQGWFHIKGGGVYDAVGYEAIEHVIERLLDIVCTGKQIWLVGEDEGFEELLDARMGQDVYADWVWRFNDGTTNNLPGNIGEEEDALALKDLIANQPIGAVVMLNQEGQLEHLDMITHVPIFRGKHIAMVRKIPVFCVNTELVDEDGLFKKTSFTKVAPMVVTKQQQPQVDDRVGCSQRASDIVKEHRLWLWPGYLGQNKVAHFAGASTEGKSPVTLDLIARVTSGSDWPDGTKNTLGPRSVILLASEDDWADTIIPRLELAGAKLELVHRFFVTKQTAEITPSLDSDCQRLQQLITELDNVGLVVIDPITNYLGSKKMNMEDEIRGGILMPLSLVAKKVNVAIVTVGHLNKRGNEAAVLQRLMGCAAFAGVARDVYMFGADPDEDDKYAHVMAEIRNKSAPKLKYRTESVPVEWGGQTSEVIRVKWCGVSHADVDAVVNPQKDAEKSKTTQAVALIKGMLRSGAKRKSDIDQALKDNGIDPEQLQFNRIKKRCKAEARAIPGRGAGWEWFIPTKKEEIFDGGAK